MTVTQRINRVSDAIVFLGLIVLGIVLVVGGVALASRTEAKADQQRIGVVISDLNGQTGIHLLSDQGILFLQPSLPDGFMVCTEFKGNGYTNCRTMRELRLPKAVK